MSLKRKLKTSVNVSWLLIDGPVNAIPGGQTDRQGGITGRRFIFRCCSGHRLKCLVAITLPVWQGSTSLVCLLRLWLAAARLTHGGWKVNFDGLTRLTSVVDDRAT